MPASSSSGQAGVDAHDGAGVAAQASNLQGAGYSFAAQYIGIDPATEDGGASVTTAQVQSDLAAGLQVVSIFETNGMSSTNFQTGAATFGWETYLTAAQGETDAAAAYKAAVAVGQPAGSAIYFAMDFDPAATDGSITEATALSRVDAYFSGIATYFATLPNASTYGVGVYGAGATLQSVASAGLAQYTWLSLSTGWDGYTINQSAGATHGWTMIQSAANAFNGVAIDQDQTASNAYGAWNTQTAPCFAAGTRILTARGAVAVEALRPGDTVLLADGATAPVMWIGERWVDCRGHACPVLVWPVLIHADAFGPGLPQRDLVLSPDHALFLDGVLIPVKYLLNGASIVQERRRSVRYYHVELPHHAVLLAEGLPAESYLDTGNRAAFSNAAGASQLHPDFAALSWDDACAPLCVAGPAVAAARRHLRGRLLQSAQPSGGWFVTTRGGVVLDSAVHGTLHRFTLSPGTAELRIVSTTGVPAGIDATSEDCRTLGIRIDGVCADGEPIPFDSTAFAAGFWGVERAGAAAWRWTDGDARLVLPVCRTLDLVVGDSGFGARRAGRPSTACRGNRYFDVARRPAAGAVP